MIHQPRDDDNRRREKAPDQDHQEREAPPRLHPFALKAVNEWDHLFAHHIDEYPLEIALHGADLVDRDALRHQVAVQLGDAAFFHGWKREFAIERASVDAPSLEQLSSFAVVACLKPDMS